MVARRGKKSYRAQVRAPVTGQVLSISGASAAEVQARAEHVQLLRRGAKYGDLDPALAQSQALQVAWSTMLLSQLWAAYYKTVQPASRGIAKADWQQRLEPHLGSRRVWDLTLPALQAWVDQLAEEGYANSTIWNSYHRLCGIVQLAVDQRKIPGRPWGAKPPRIRGRPPREREACTSIDEFLELVHQAQSHDHDNWKRGRVSDLAPRVVVAGMCGLRNGELGGLGWDDLLLEGPEPRMVVRHQVKDGWDRRHPEWDRPLDLPKACDPRDPPKVLRIHPGVVQFLHAQRAELERLGWYRSSGPVFPAKGGRWRTKSDTIRPDDLRRLAARAGFDNVERWTTHSLRHTQATLELAFSGGDLRRVQERTRHASIEVMSGYLHMLHRGRPPSAIPELEGLTPMVRGEPVRRELPELPAGPEPAEPPAAAFADLASA
ncbi:MAG: tyrosine-type recombinase/integrase, partial [Planctomycetota bacterium]